MEFKKALLKDLKVYLTDTEILNWDTNIHTMFTIVQTEIVGDHLILSTKTKKYKLEIHDFDFNGVEA